ncbi:ral guanine nucleotide dissociation stimulator-like [Chionomys nivalis]|uniref:ral guanine nucleotide dissociation stimulator-like n=1 Tax=Chionomys nivalis TaxID=269649 RepID=UPI002594B8E4|nr:ral guanine nucleotide dissociation stimulator-like [Chionomys nivalis]XP_057613227.1 ral guanine nucleotide dissociation stimulator-like [Chionomys nivalis]XP_057613228.1 ral guanine nucleotide dissociation stimulator-like [Chionomys nivalis]XP_057613229.1 ral guanine nucleotide dissociation stimulator-like [Chionomys nivalis]XP_057613230.1 ral guanine nucleotide dissociation stimulator-like [Chionomys nivalis]XP_057613231.1 ral guanine nucleotide dissociation stimulator-like [Chionomys ni
MVSSLESQLVYLPRDLMGSATEDQLESIPGDTMDCTLEVQLESILVDSMDPAPGDLTESFPGDPVDSALQDQLEDQKDSVPGDPKILDFGHLDEVVKDLITSFQNGDREYLIAFLSTYPAHTTIEQVLDVIFRRYARFRPGCQEDERLKNTICTLLDMWTSVFPGDFATTSGMSALKRVKTYLIIHFPYSDVLIRVHELLTRLLSETSEESD